MGSTVQKPKPRPRRDARRSSLTRERVLAEALRLVDEQGLEALTLRALAARLGVEAMSLYNHVDGKEGLRDGIRELLWQELRDALERGTDWRESLRAIARHLRRLSQDHPQAFPLIIGGSSLAEPMLRTAADGLAMLGDAGFDDECSARTLNSVIHYALGYAMMELAFRTTIGIPRGGEPELDALVRLVRTLPPDAPAELVRVARDCCACDYDAQFEFGLEALLGGLDPQCVTRGDR